MNAHDNCQKIQAAIDRYGKRSTLAEELGTSAGNLSKILNGDIETFCRLLTLVGLEVHPAEYVRSLETILREKL